MGHHACVTMKRHLGQTCGGATNQLLQASAMGSFPIYHAIGWIFLYFLFILQNYTTVSKFIRFDHQMSWRTAAAVAHGGFKSNRHVLRRLGQPPRGPRAGRPATVDHDGSPLFAVGHGGRPRWRGLRR
jgi:hypothetical protein